MSLLKIAVVFGTRPEAIKMAPVIKELKSSQNNGKPIDLKVIVTGQHRSMLDQALEIFKITPDFDLNIMKPDQNLFTITSSILLNIASIFSSYLPDIVLVHGDTTTTFTVSLAAFYSKIKVGHVEAGLRSHNKYSPFPEEVNRHLSSVLTDYHFSPTEQARINLIKEGINPDKIIVTGNTVVDSLKYILKQINLTKFDDDCFKFPLSQCISNGKKLILVTGHRRENFGNRLKNICKALIEIVNNNNNIEIVYPVHLNPNVKEPVSELLGSTESIHLIDPLDYQPFVYLMSKSYLILTDSGGIQEEAPTLGIPVLVMRDVTERNEGVEAGVTKLVGANWRVIYEETTKLIQDRIQYKKMSRAQNPYGDGNAAKRITNFLFDKFSL